MESEDIELYTQNYKNLFIRLNYFNSSFIALNSYHYKYTKNIDIIYKSPSLFINGIYIKLNGIRRENLVLNHLVDIKNKKDNEIIKTNDLIVEIKDNIDIDLNDCIRYETNKIQDKLLNNIDTSSNTDSNIETKTNLSHNPNPNPTPNPNLQSDNKNIINVNNNYFYLKLNLNYHFDIIPKLLEMDLEILNNFESIKKNFTIKKDFVDINSLKCNPSIKKVDNDTFLIGKIYFNCSIDRIINYFNSQFFNNNEIDFSLVINKIQIKNNLGHIRLDFLDL